MEAQSNVSNPSGSQTANAGDRPPSYWEFNTAPDQISSSADPGLEQENGNETGDSHGDFRRRSMTRGRDSGSLGDVTHACRECQKEFRRSIDLKEHEKNHSRPWKCSEPKCKYHEQGWPTKKELDRHVNDKHSAAPPLYKCLFPPCDYSSKRMNNCAQHMERAHGENHTRGQRSKAMRVRPSDPFVSTGTIRPTPDLSPPPTNVSVFVLSPEINDNIGQSSREQLFGHGIGGASHNLASSGAKLAPEAPPDSLRALPAMRSNGSPENEAIRLLDKPSPPRPYCHRDRLAQPSLADGVLISYLGPTSPDVARRAEESPTTLYSDSEKREWSEHMSEGEDYCARAFYSEPIRRTDLSSESKLVGTAEQAKALVAERAVEQTVRAGSTLSARSNARLEPFDIPFPWDDPVFMEGSDSMFAYYGVSTPTTPRLSNKGPVPVHANTKDAMSSDNIAIASLKYGSTAAYQLTPMQTADAQDVLYDPTWSEVIHEAESSLLENMTDPPRDASSVYVEPSGARIMMAAESTTEPGPDGQATADDCMEIDHSRPSDDPKQRSKHNNKVMQSDSGYHGGLGTNTSSACSLNSVGNSLGIPKDLLEDFVACFGDVLIERAGARAWAEVVLAERQPEYIEQCLNELLRDYALALPYTTMAEQALPGHKQYISSATRLIRKYRLKIAHYFRVNAGLDSSITKSIAAPLQKLGEQLSVTEKLRFSEKVASTVTDSDQRRNGSADGEENEDDVDGKEYITNLRGIQEFLVSSKSFQQLTMSIRRSLYFDDRSMLNRIRDTVIEGLAADVLHSDRFGFLYQQQRASLEPLAMATDANVSSYCRGYRATFNVKCDLVGFMKSQVGSKIPQIGSLLVLSGSALYTYANTCSEYLREMWPHGGTVLLSALQIALTSEKKTSTDETELYGTARCENLELQVRVLDDGTVFARARGTVPLIIEIAQQLSWIGSALRLSPYDDKISYSEPVFTRKRSHSPVSPELGFDISFKSEPLHPTENPCWLPLFGNAVIARAFPIPERRNEVGLEIPLAILAGLAGVRHAVEFEGGVVMKGYSTMLIPTKRRDDVVQWHLFSSSDSYTRLSYHAGLRLCGARAMLDVVQLDSISMTRAIVGWASPAHLQLGSDTANYENINYSDAAHAHCRPRIAGATLGFQHFGMASLDVQFGPKDGKSHIKRTGPFRRVIACAETTRILLYDTGAKQAWLVPCSAVMLHIAQHRLRTEPFQADGKSVKLKIFGSARDTRLGNASTNLSNDEDYTFKELILDIWSTLEFLLDQKGSYDGTPGKPLRGTPREQLQGFEYKAILEERSPFQQKMCYISKTSGCWPSLIQDVGALVLLANGFKDIIRPSEHSEGLCHQWRTVPKGKDYLATTTDMLLDLYNEAGDPHRRWLTTGCYLEWHRGAMLFESCPAPHAYICNCNRLQQMVPKSVLRDAVAPGLIPKGAAIIFGRSGTFLQHISQRTQQQLGNGLYSQPNVALMPTPSQHSPEELSASVVSDATHSSSSSATTDLTVPSTATSQSSLEIASNEPEPHSTRSSYSPSFKKRAWDADVETVLMDATESHHLRHFHLAQPQTKNKHVKFVHTDRTTPAEHCELDGLKLGTPTKLVSHTISSLETDALTLRPFDFKNLNTGLPFEHPVSSLLEAEKETSDHPDFGDENRRQALSQPPPTMLKNTIFPGSYHGTIGQRSYEAPENLGKGYDASFKTLLPECEKKNFLDVQPSSATYITEAGLPQYVLNRQLNRQPRFERDGKIIRR